MAYVREKRTSKNHNWTFCLHNKALVVMPGIALYKIKRGPVRKGESESFARGECDPVSTCRPRSHTAAEESPKFQSNHLSLSCSNASQEHGILLLAPALAKPVWRPCSTTLWPLCPSPSALSPTSNSSHRVLSAELSEVASSLKSSHGFFPLPGMPCLPHLSQSLF